LVTLSVNVTVCVIFPPLAVTTGRTVVTLALDPFVNVRVVLPVACTVTRLKLALTPAGNPAIENDTAEVNPPSGRVVNTNFAGVFELAETALVLAERLNPGTFTLTVAVFVTPPPVAVTVSEYVPATTVAPAVRVKVLLPEPGAEMLAGANCAVIPAGIPLIWNATAELNVAFPVVVNVTVLLLPVEMLTAVAGAAAKVNVGAGSTVKLTDRLWLFPAPLAETLMAYVPATALVAAVSFSVLVPEPGETRVAGVSVPVTPFGNPLNESVTAALNPPLIVVLTLWLTLAPPTVTVAFAGTLN